MKTLALLFASKDFQKILKVIGYIAGGLLVFFLLRKGFQRLDVALNPDKYLGKNKKVNPENLPKGKEHYAAIANDLYNLLDKNTGFTDNEVKAIVRNLTPEERIVVANHFSEVLKKSGDLGCGNIINWLEDDGLKNEANLFVQAGVERGKKTSWFC